MATPLPLGVYNEVSRLFSQVGIPASAFGLRAMDTAEDDDSDAASFDVSPFGWSPPDSFYLTEVASTVSVEGPAPYKEVVVAGMDGPIDDIPLRLGHAEVLNGMISYAGGQRPDREKTWNAHVDAVAAFNGWKEAHTGLCDAEAQYRVDCPLSRNFTDEKKLMGSLEELALNHISRSFLESEVPSKLAKVLKVVKFIPAHNGNAMDGRAFYSMRSMDKLINDCLATVDTKTQKYFSLCFYEPQKGRTNAKSYTLGIVAGRTFGIFAPGHDRAENCMDGNDMLKKLNNLVAGVSNYASCQYVRAAELEISTAKSANVKVKTKAEGKQRLRPGALFNPRGS